MSKLSIAIQDTIDMVLHCPKCGMQHIDVPDGDWTNPPHKSHLCHGCAHVWRPADVLTNGVVAVTTAGSKDSPIVMHSTPKVAQVTPKHQVSYISYMDFEEGELDRKHAAEVAKARVEGILSQVENQFNKECADLSAMQARAEKAEAAMVKGLDDEIGYQCELETALLEMYHSAFGAGMLRGHTGMHAGNILNLHEYVMLLLFLINRKPLEKGSFNGESLVDVKARLDAAEAKQGAQINAILKQRHEATPPVILHESRTTWSTTPFTDIPQVKNRVPFYGVPK